MIIRLADAPEGTLDDPSGFLEAYYILDCYSRVLCREESFAELSYGYLNEDTYCHLSNYCTFAYDWPDGHAVEYQIDLWFTENYDG